MKNIAWFVLIFVIVFLIPKWYLINNESTKTKIKTDFETACVSANGKPVWNGRQWECLK